MTTDLDALLTGVDGERMAGTVTALAGAPFAGRRAGSPGGGAARGWLGEQLHGLGAEPAVDPFPVRTVPEVYAAPEVIWSDGATTRRLAFGRQMAVHLASADHAAIRRGGLAVAGAGDPAGRWLLVPAGMSLFDAYGHADGALGLLIGRPVDAHGWHFTMLAGPDPGPLPVLTLDPATHAAMLAAAPTGRAWLAGNTPIRRADVTAANLHGRWRLAAGEAADLLLTAHYDGVGDHPGLRQPAASDNGSGVAVVLEAAAVEAGGPAHRLLALLDQAGRHTGLPLAAGSVASDNRRYAAAGFAAVGIGAGMGGYHSPADTPDRVDTMTLVAICRLVVATVWLAATAPATLSSLIGD